MSARKAGSGRKQDSGTRIKGTHFTLSDTSALWRKVRDSGPLPPLQQLQRLQYRLNELPYTFKFYSTSGGAGSPTGRVRVFSRLRTHFKRLDKPTQTHQTFTYRADEKMKAVGFRLLKYAVAETLDHKNPEKIIGTETLEQEYRRLLRESLPELIGLCSKLIDEAEKQKNKSGHMARRQSDDRVDLIYMDLMTTYEEFFDQRSTVSATGEQAASGPLFRFLEEIFARHQLKQTPDGSRARIRKLHELRQKHGGTYDFGYGHLK